VPPAGAGGVCDGEEDEEQEPLFDQSQCRARRNFLESTCGEALTRETLGCGEPGISLDANCCHRAECVGDSGCAAGERCIPRLTQGPYAIGGSIILGCSLQCGECSCIGTADIDMRAYCIPLRDVEAFDCNVTNRTCGELLGWHENLRLDGVALGTQPLDFSEQRTDECMDRIEQAIATECEPACTCSGDRCLSPIAAFCPFEEELGCPVTLERAKTPASLCRHDITTALYSECADGTQRILFTEFHESTYELVFNPRTGNLNGADAFGYVGGLCGLDGEELRQIQAGHALRSSSCEVCEFCREDDPGVPNCVFDAEGRIALP